MSGMCGPVRSSFWFADVMSGTRTTWHAYSYLWTLFIIAPLRSKFGAPESKVTKSGLSIRSVLVMLDVGKLQGRQYIPSASKELDVPDSIVIAPFFGFVSSSSSSTCCWCCGCEFPSAILVNTACRSLMRRATALQYFIVSASAARQFDATVRASSAKFRTVNNVRWQQCAYLFR